MASSAPSGRPLHFLLCHERFLFRFGADRVLLLLARALRDRGHRITLAGCRFDAGVVSALGVDSVRVEVDGVDTLDLDTAVARWLERSWVDRLGDDPPDLALIGGWPFFGSLAVLRGLGVATTFLDFGAVPIEGMDPAQSSIQLRLRRLRKKHLGRAHSAIAISDFIADSQTRIDAPELEDVRTILLGADHLEQDLWSSEALSREGQRSGIEEIEKAIRTGRRIVFAGGRYEPGTYKRSEHLFDIARFLRLRSAPPFCIAICGDDAEIDIPADVADTIILLGHPSDADLLQIMRLSDAGLSTSTWEGFNLSIAEMQWVGKPVVALNRGAHPEVNCLPWALAEDLEDAADKLASLLISGPPDPDELERALAQFRDRLAWSRVGARYAEALEEQAACEMPSIVVEVSGATLDPANNGIPRVTRRLTRELQDRARVWCAVFDDGSGQPILPCRERVARLSAYNGPRAESLPTSGAGIARPLLEAMAEAGEPPRWFLLPELTSGPRLRWMIRQAARSGFRTAAVFYDAIPLERPDLVAPYIAAQHADYVDALAECDLVLPISESSSSALSSLWEGRWNRTPPVVTCPLPDELGGVDRARRAKVLSASQPFEILCVSTVEPRKGHLRLLRALRLLDERAPAVDWRLTLVGGRYGGLAESVSLAVRGAELHDSRIRWLGVVSDDDLSRLYEESTLSVYASIIEGFGLPIVESLWHATPVLCHDRGVMSELAAAGGCLTADLTDESRFSRALERLLTDPDLYTRLSREATRRTTRSWRDYVGDVFDALDEAEGADAAEAAPVDVIPDGEGQLEPALHPDAAERRCSRPPSPPSRAPASDDARAPRARPRAPSSPTHRKSILLACNFYPPTFVGGAEIAAHQQARELSARGHRVTVFAGETSERRGDHYRLRFEVVDGVEVHRISLPVDHFQESRGTFTCAEVESRFQRVLRSTEPDVFHAHNLIGLSAGLLPLARSFGARVVVTLHDHWGFCHKNTLLESPTTVCRDRSQCSVCRPTLSVPPLDTVPIRMRNDLIRLAAGHVDTFVSPSRYLAAAYEEAGIGEGRFRVVPNGIDRERFRREDGSARSSEALSIAFVGSLYPHKAPAVLARALTLVDGADGIRADFVGAGPEEAVCREVLRTADREHRTQFHGRVDNSEVPAILAQADVLVLCSVWPENHPVTILEAFASGTPVLAPNIGGIPELVETDVNGLLYPAGDARALARSLERIRDEPELHSRLCRGALDTSRRFSQSRAARGLEAVYDEPRLDQPEIPPHLVVCTGAPNADHGELMASFPPEEGWCFVHARWIGEEVARRAWVHWRLPGETGLPLQADAPTLIDLSDPELRTLRPKVGVLHHGGLAEARGLILRLRRDPDLRARLVAGRNLAGDAA